MATQTMNTCFDRMRKAAARGDVEGVRGAWAAYARENPSPGISAENEFMAQMGEALDTLARINPSSLPENLIGAMLAFQGKLLLRIQRHIEGELEHLDRQHSGVPMNDTVAEIWLPRLSRIQTSILETSKALATTTHTLGLAAAPRPVLKRRAGGKVIDFREERDALSVRPCR